MKIDTSTWKWFVIEDLFDKFETGKGHDTLLDDGEECFYLGAKKSDNGIMRKCAVNESMLQDGNCIVFICNGAGSVGYANYMDRPFIATTDLVLGYADWLNEKTGLFVATVLCKERFKYSFGRKWKTHLRDTQIKLPATPDGKPDWQWMESYINSLHSEPLKTSNGSKAALGTFVFDIREWHEFRVEELFDSIYKVASYDDSELERVDMWGKKTVPYVTRTDLDNSVKSLVSSTGLANIEAGNAIVIGDTTSTISYQPGPFVAGEHIIAARAEWMNKYTGLFVTCLLRQERYRYSYGRAYKLDSIRNTELRLPVTPDGKPDWQWMENYIKSLPYGDRL